MDQHRPNYTTRSGAPASYRRQRRAIPPARPTGHAAPSALLCCPLGPIRPWALRIEFPRRMCRSAPSTTQSRGPPGGTQGGTAWAGKAPSPSSARTPTSSGPRGKTTRRSERGSPDRAALHSAAAPAEQQLQSKEARAVMRRGKRRMSVDHKPEGRRAPF